MGYASVDKMDLGARFPANNSPAAILIPEPWSAYVGIHGFVGHAALETNRQAVSRVVGAVATVSLLARGERTWLNPAGRRAKECKDLAFEYNAGEAIQTFDAAGREHTYNHHRPLRKAAGGT